VQLTRRTWFGGLAATAVLATGGFLWFPGRAPAVGVSDASPQDVLSAVREGRVLLVDIRRPDEWKQTGVPEGAVAIDLRRPDFVDAVQQARSDTAQPVAVICARGVRSRRLTAQLIDAGITPIIDVPEGMLGSFAGPGWLKRGLPVVAWSG
jgi:rhodanese-related sulfurtransferase